MIRISLLLPLLLLNVSITAFCQDFDYHRDFEKILSLSKDNSTSLYYPKLLQRFHKNDSTLTHTEVLALQIGYTNSKHYAPYKTIKEERQLLKLVQQKKYPEALKVCNKVLTTNPLSLAALMQKEFVYGILKPDSLPFYRDKSQKIINATIASGDGSLEKPFFILSPLDGQLLITNVWAGTMGAMASVSDQNGYFIDILEFQKEGKQAQMLHFHIAHAVARMFSEEERAEMDKVFEEGEDVLSKKRKTKN